MIDSRATGASRCRVALTGTVISNIVSLLFSCLANLGDYLPDNSFVIINSCSSVIGFRGLKNLLEGFQGF